MKILRSLQNIIIILISSINIYFTTGTTRTSRSISVLFDKKVFPFGFIDTPLNAWLRGNMKHISLSQNAKPADGSLICRHASCNHYPITDQNMGFSKSLPNCQTRFQRAQKRSLLQTKTAKNDLCLIPNQKMVPNTKAA